VAAFDPPDLGGLAEPSAERIALWFGELGPERDVFGSTD
jgi:hypothetical protein